MSLDHKSAPFHRSLAARLRSWFFTGLVVFGPVAVTAYIAWWVIDTVDNWVKPWLPQKPFAGRLSRRSTFPALASSSQSSV